MGLHIGLDQKIDEDMGVRMGDDPGTGRFPDGPDDVRQNVRNPSRSLEHADQLAFVVSDGKLPCS